MDAATAILTRFAAVAGKAVPAELRSILGDHIERVDVRFTHALKGKKTQYTFAEATVWLREDSPLSSCLIWSGKPRSSRR